ncbi:Glycoside hydrolase family 27 [Penicillium paradoxum]|uniref:Glycoside hydrolase family 27 n=1 Tax=Penicillium paradoxum TaxID=176176 RepID=UPI0025493FA3|nr:Glycoside hydrolase family 27 [Penicillium paradoxum]KAJ5782594.1 Glycoside hydrolase family 27 [Penicillium paradoxum]
MKTSSPANWAVASMAGLFMSPLLVQASTSNTKLLPAPPMGFNNWARFMCDLNETLFTDTADSMRSRGLLAAGYNRLTLDDCWMRMERSANGSLEWDTDKFPNGIPWLREEVKSKGFLLGIYEDSGDLTCGGYPGSYQYEKQDAELFASWGIDYLKMDGCNVEPEEGRSLREEYDVRYSKWHDILSALPEPLIFSNSAPAYFQDNASDWAVVMDSCPEYGELARHSADVQVFETKSSPWNSIMFNYDYHTLLVRYQQPGYYNDPDFLITDNPYLSKDEKASQFALWASLGAPLIISAHIPDLTDDEIKLLSNEALIAVDQDPLAQQAALVSRDGTFDVLSRSLESGDRLLAVVNRGDNAGKTSVPLARLGLSDSKCEYKARELLTGKETTVDSAFDIQLNSHATAVYRVELPEDCDKTIPTGMVFHTPSGLCMTASGQSVSYEKCSASDSQVWQVAGKDSKVTLSPLSDTSLCLAGKDGQPSLATCEDGAGTTWEHYLTGHLRNEDAGGCLTKGSGKGIEACVVDNAAQIFGLASGVRLADKGLR